MRHRPHTWKIKYRYNPSTDEYRWFVWFPHDAEAQAPTFATWHEAAAFLWEVYRLQKAKKRAIRDADAAWPSPKSPPIFPFPAGH